MLETVSAPAGEMVLGMGSCDNGQFAAESGFNFLLYA